MPDSGPRAHGPFIEVNCAAIPDTMLEAELFGYEAGAFTDAKRAKAGLFEAAGGGTLFLDEIDALPLLLQSKLLTVIEEKRLRRLGALMDHAIDVKLIAATQADLPGRVADGRFRLNLYHRLAVVLLQLPPLQARGEDILALAQQFLQRAAAGHRLPRKRLSPAAEAWLLRYPWPGNVRELDHLLERITLLHPEEVIDATTLARWCLPRPHTVTDQDGAPTTSDDGGLDEPTRIRQALAQTGGNVVRASQLLGLRRDALRYRMRRYGIVPPTLADLKRAPALHPAGAERSDGGPGASDHPQGLSSPAMSAGLPSAWEQKLVAVLAIDITWPEATALQVLPYEPWTMAARWVDAMVEKIQGFGGVVLQHAPSLLLAAFGVPQTLEQMPQRAVHAALALRRLTDDESPPSWGGPRPVVRLGLHWGPLLVAAQAGEMPPRVLHENIAQVMERLFADHLQDYYQELAHHYGRNGNTAKALEYLQLAGRQAAQRAAFDAAITHLTAALHLLHTLPKTLERAKQELDLHVALGRAFVATKGHAAPETEYACVRA